MKVFFLILFLIIKLVGYSQEHSSLFERDKILENKVYKVLEYDPTDSLNYFKKYPNGYYSNYDKFGRMTECNHYSPFKMDSIWMPGEFKNYYLYDSDDNRIGFAQIHENMESPFRFFQIQSFDKENNRIKTASLEKSWQVNSNFIFNETDLKTDKLTNIDTVNINDFQKNVYYDADSLNYSELFLNKEQLVDSMINHGIYSDASGQHNSETIIKFEYYSNGKIKKVTNEFYSLKQERKLYSRNEYFYFDTGLLDMMTSYFTINERREISKFKYYYRKI